LRIKLLLEQKKQEQLIPFNYQYPLSTIIYKIIEEANGEYAKWLHDSGFRHGYKSFKFFTFSALQIPEYEQKGSKIIIKSRNITLTVSMLSDETIENFIIGLFNKRDISIFDNTTKADFRIRTVERESPVEFREEMLFSTMSPIVLTKKTIYNGKESTKYLSPVEDENYLEYFRKNLEEKYLANCLSKDINVKEEKINKIEITSEPKSKLITVKEGQKEQTKIKGYLYNFRISADLSLIKIGYYTGFGKLCSLGMGCARIIQNTNKKDEKNNNRKARKNEKRINRMFKKNET